MLNRFRFYRERGWEPVDAGTYRRVWDRFGGSVITHPQVVERLWALADHLGSVRDVIERNPRRPLIRPRAKIGVIGRKAGELLLVAILALRVGDGGKIADRAVMLLVTDRAGQFACCGVRIGGSGARSALFAREHGEMVGRNVVSESSQLRFSRPLS